MSNIDNSLRQPPDKGVVAVYRSHWQLFTANLLGGLAWGLGSVLGATLIVAAILFTLNLLGGLPVIGSYIKDISDAITSGMRH